MTVKYIAPSRTGADKSAAAPRKAIILVPGMHRCGTSALSGALNLLGVAIPGELLRPDDHNKRGYFENKRINGWHEKLLDQLKSRWDDPLPLGEAELRSICTGGAARDLVAVFRQECNGEPLVLVKDPRLCRLLPLWIEAFAGSDYDLFAILPIRHPFEVAASLHRRDSLPLAQGLALWLQHVLAAERASRRLPRCFVSYDDLLRDWRSSVHRIERTLGLAWPGDIIGVAGEIDDFLSLELRHHHSAADTPPAADALHHLCLRAWDALSLLCTDGANEAARARLDQVAVEYERALDVLGPLVAALGRRLLGREAAERDDAARREAALQYWQDWVKREHGRLEQDLKAERDNAHGREATLRGLVEAERDAADRSARVLEESGAQNRRLSEEVANLQTHLHALTTSTRWRAPGLTGRAVTGASAKPGVVSPELVKSISDCFDEVWYDQKYGLTARDLHGVDHYLRIGMNAGYSPNAAFDELFYLSTNPDVAEAVQTGALRCGFEHYIRHGRFEGRSGQGRPEEPALSVAEAPHDLAVAEVPPDLANLVAGCFDQVWYDQHYGLTARTLRGLDHYFKIGMKVGYSPNSVFDEGLYLSTNPDVAEAVRAGAVLCGFAHYIQQGRFEARSGGQGRPYNYSHLRPMFDEEWYDRTYKLNDEELHGFADYLAEGARRGYSPYADFDEKFYAAFYSDVKTSVSSRGYLCGYEHYVMVGRAENRLTKPILTKMLDQRYPGLTNPVGLAQAREIERRLTPIAACPGADEESYWILVPTLDPNIFFAGYKALMEFIVGLGSLKRPITVVICHDSEDDGSYFRYWTARQAQIAEAFRTVRIVNGRLLEAPLRLSPTDKIFAYSAWEAHLAHHMAAHVKSGLFAWLVQEYESVFHDYSADHSITANAYRLPHYPIFNSTELKDYFQHHRLGIFSGDPLPSPGRDFAVFNHVLTKLPTPTLADLKSRSSRTLIFYARPEPHAQRNLFPLALIALEEMAQQGSFVGPWELHGVGALTEMTIPLGGGHNLNLRAKMAEAEYVAFMQKVDIGLSLMYAPHPGLMAFEMASVGARVVTNTFDNRSETYLRGVSENIIPCEPTISGIKQALTEAMESLHDYSGRVRGMRLNRSQGANSWPEVFNDEFFHHEMGGFLGTDQQNIVN